MDSEVVSEHGRGLPDNNELEVPELLRLESAAAEDIPDEGDKGRRG